MSAFLEGLNDAQRQAVTHERGPLLIVAGAGTGKTTVLTRRYASLLERGCKPDEILALTFTDKAAGEMEDRVMDLLPTGTYDFWISTFHGFCQRVLEKNGLEIGLPNQFRLITPTDAWLLLKRHLDALPLDHYRPLGNPTKFLRALVTHISRAKDEGVTPERYLAFAQEAVLDQDAETADGERKRLQELADLYAMYRKILLEEGALDFGDLILETLRLFRERPATLAAYRAQFKHILVDEFQDTNWAQYELLKLLLGADRNLTVVGDDDQAIYKFRGASLANILQFRDDFPDAVTVALSQNYRSTQTILDTAYSFIKRNDPNRLEVRLKETGLTKQLTSARGEGGTIEVLWESSVEEEAESVAERIQTLKQEDAGACWNDFAVLVRSNDSAEPFVQQFEQRGVPYQFLALRGLYAKPAVLDALSLLSLGDGFHDSTRVWRALHLPCDLLPPTDIAELVQYANRKGIPLWSVVTAAASGHPGIPVSDDGRAILRKISDRAGKLRETARRSPPIKVLQEALEHSGYLAWVLRLPEREKREALSHLNGFADRVRRYEQSTHGPTLRGFLDEFRVEVESGEEGSLEVDPEAGPDMVKILTVHAAKGLEFRYVFVVSLVDQRFPTRARGEAIPLPDGLVQERLPEGDVHLEEERRLFYVALTRAKDRLILTGAEKYGGVRAKKPSPFFAEAGIELPSRAGSARAEEGKRLRAPQSVTLEEVRTLYNLKRRFSFTQLAAFRKCPLQYKFAHVYRIPILGSFQKSFGQSVHLAFQRILDMHQTRNSSSQASLFGDPAAPAATPGGFRVTEEESLQQLEDAWIDEWYPNRDRHDEYKRMGIQSVKHFWRACAAQAPDVVAVEKPFTLLLGTHSIKGKIDRMDALADGSVAVVDYKTGRAKEKLEAEDREQLHLYQVALEEQGIRVGRLSYIYVQEWVTADVDPLLGEERDEFLDKVTKRMDDILLSNFPPTPDPFACKYCDFREICEHRKL